MKTTGAVAEKKQFKLRKGLALAFAEEGYKLQVQKDGKGGPGDCNSRDQGRFSFYGKKKNVEEKKKAQNRSRI